MKSLKYILLIAGLSLTTVSCKKFLNIVPIDNLSGNNFWQTEKDVEGYTNGLYQAFRAKTTETGSFFPTFDLRCSAAKSLSGTFVPQLVNNDLRGLAVNAAWISSTTNYKNITTWKGFFDIIQAANILYSEIDNVPDPAFSAADKKRYKAEAVFVRNLTYFFMIRLYGDVPYYTNAFNETPLPRTPMVTVLNKCIADLSAVKNDLPWTYDDPSLVGIRAMRGGAIALLMHMNMWAAGFDEANKNAYYTAVKALGIELTSTNTYQLLPLTADNSKAIFKGRTKESLFEILQNSNYGETFAAAASFSYFSSHYPYSGTVTTLSSRMYFDKKFMDMIYSDGIADDRKNIWFQNRAAQDGTFQFTKFINVYTDATQTVIDDDDFIVFRLSDALLLAAEAEADLGEESEALRYLKIVRDRSNATVIQSTGDNLKDDIYFERVRELMGEGQYYFDLVRTKKILDPKYCLHPMSVSDFNAGAWTWPIDASALVNNPYMTLNNFWR